MFSTLVIIFIKKCIEQINPFHIHNYLVFSRIVAGSFSEKFSYRSHVFQWELAMSDFLDYQKTVWQVTCLSEEIQLATPDFLDYQKTVWQVICLSEEIQLAKSDFLDYQKTVWQVICLSDGIQMAVSDFLMCYKFWYL